MKENTINDFEIGDIVCHLSNHTITMVVIDIHIDINELECRLINGQGDVKVMSFLSQELFKL